MSSSASSASASPIALEKLKRMFSFTGLTQQVAERDFTSQVGFKITFCSTTGKLRVKIIGARQLPTQYGSVKPIGYIVKVRMFPGKEKYETELVKESWPNFSQEFEFPLNGALVGKFISFTAYAVLQQNVGGGLSKTGSLRMHLGILTGRQVDDGENMKKGKKRFLNRQTSLNNRRTIGVATYNLDEKCFTQKLKNGYVGTPDIWRTLEEISSGMDVESRESKKGSVEATLTYSMSEDGNNDLFELGLSRMRCSMQTMQSHEKFGGQLYIKVTANEYDVQIAKLKSDRFEPTISLKMEQTTSTLLATVNRSNLSQVRFVIRLICRNLLGKKILLGKIEIDGTKNLWKEAVGSPSNPVTKMLDFE